MLLAPFSCWCQPVCVPSHGPFGGRGGVSNNLEAYQIVGRGYGLETSCSSNFIVPTNLSVETS